MWLTSVGRTFDRVPALPDVALPDFMLRARCVGHRAALVCLCLLFQHSVNAQPPREDRSAPVFGSDVSASLEELFEGGLDFLVSQQREDGSWRTRPTYGSRTAGGTAICTLALLARGDDPNWGQYAPFVRRGLRYVIRQQGASGRFTGNSYDFAFSMLLLAEACGVVDDDMLWAGVAEAKRPRTITEALELAVRGAVVPPSERRLRHAGWYSTADTPESGEPDCSVAGSLLIALLAARNAGIRVPDHTVDLAVEYLEANTSADGEVAYFRGKRGNGHTIGRTALTTLCMAVAKRRASPAYSAGSSYLLTHLEQVHHSDPHYADYYMAQALFQSDRNAWKKWNQMMMHRLLAKRNVNGSIGHSRYGDNYATAMSLLTLAVNYRLLPIYER
ncbi:MAG: squalene--hopene cyclase [Planctomycetaceae bacterium]|nr:squalene--hopene cyclase [Planctomycetaceae bacterium]